MKNMGNVFEAQVTEISRSFQGFFHLHHIIEKSRFLFHLHTVPLGELIGGLR